MLCRQQIQILLYFHFMIFISANPRSQHDIKGTKKADRSGTSGRDEVGLECNAYRGDRDLKTNRTIRY